MPDPNKAFPIHPTEEILEEYLFHRLPEVLTAQVEEHLLTCQSCQDAVAETDRFVSALKAAVQQPDPIARPVLSGWRISVPIFALAALALVVIWTRPQESSTPVAVSLSSLRAADSLAPAPAGKPLLLDIETPDLSQATDYRVEVVDATGRPVWRGSASGSGGKLIASPPKPLATGVYWVRLYGVNSELLREFGLSAK